MSFTDRIEVQLSSTLSDTSAFTLKAYPILARILFNCQRAIIMEKWGFSIEPGRSIEIP
jgi:hypothetical protein